MVNTTAREAPTIPAPTVPAIRAETPDAFRHYIVERRPDGALWELGRGGMGVTYKAIDVNLRCPVALKIIGPQCFGSESSRRRFIREARLAAQIRHPNVAAIYHLDTQDDDVFYAMEFVDGVTADEWVKKRGPMTAELALDVGMQVSRALTAADRMKLVHRDIKPSNIMLLADPADHRRLIVKVIDFGLACSQSGEVVTTATTCSFVGTPQFSSPEQIDNLELDIRSDIYSLGCTLWFLLAGQAPFTGSVARVLSQQLTSNPPFENLGNVPRAVTALLRSLLAKSPDARPQTPIEVHAEICRCRESLSRQAATLKLRRLPVEAARAAWLRPPVRFVCYALLAGSVIASAAWISVPPDDAREGDPIPAGMRLAAATVVPSEGRKDPRDRNEADRQSMDPATATAESLAPQPLESATASEEPGVTLFSAEANDDDIMEVRPFWMVGALPAIPPAMDLRSTPPIALSISGAMEKGTLDKPAGKPAARTGRRRAQNVDRRSSPLEPVQRAGRTIRNFVNRLF